MTETDLRWQLRQLPREIEPTRDLWPGIAAGIERRPLARAPRRWLTPMAMAASMLLAAGLFWRSDAGQGPAAAPADPSATLVRVQSQEITREYQAALRQFDGVPMPAQVEPGLKTLDRSVVQIQRAIAADPKSVYLLDQLRRTYSRRLELTQRAVTS